MLTFYLAIVALMVIACTGGSVRRLADVRVRYVWALWGAFITQLLIITVIPNFNTVLFEAIHIATYVVGAVCFWVNRRLPGAWFIAAGGALNGIVIMLNGGKLPASESALRMAGRTVSTDHFDNSTPVADPVLPWLGDVFATPAWLPGHTVFSVGDIIIWGGVFWFLWRTCRPRRNSTAAPENRVAAPATPATPATD
jgi:hypothetical protein